MKTNKKVAVGAVLLAMMMIANVHNAMNDYGIRSNAFMNGVVASGSEGSGTENGKQQCRRVICVDLWIGSANAGGCLIFFGNELCSYEPNVSIAIPYLGFKEKCSLGDEWQDCDACQTDCVP